MGFYDQEILRSITNNLSEDKESYKKFFNAAMKKFGIKSPLELPDAEKKKEFYDYIDNNYSAKNEGVREGLLSEIPASVFAAAAAATMKNPKTGKDIKVSTAAKNKEHPLHQKAMSWIKSHTKDKKKDAPKKAAPKKQSKSDADFWKKQYGVSESAPAGWEGTVKEVAMPLGSYLEHALEDVGHLIDVVKGDHAEDAYQNAKKSSKLLIAAFKLLKKVK